MLYGFKHVFIKHEYSLNITLNLNKKAENNRSHAIVNRCGVNCVGPHVQTQS